MVEAATDFKGQTAGCGVEGRLLPRSWSAGCLAARCDGREEDDGKERGSSHLTHPYGHHCGRGRFIMLSTVNEWVDDE